MLREDAFSPGPAPFWNVYVFLCYDQPLLNLSCLQTLNFEHPSVLLFCFMYICVQMLIQVYLLIFKKGTVTVREGHQPQGIDNVVGILQYDSSPIWMTREKEGDLTQSYDKTPLYQQKIRNSKDNTQTPSKTSITQRLRTDLGRSDGVKTVIQLVWLNRFTGTQPSH